MSITAQPDSGQISPDVLVQTGTTVTASGSGSIDIICNSDPGSPPNQITVDTTDLPVKFSLAFRPRGGLETGISSQLKVSGNIATFTPRQRGFYTVTAQASLGVRSIASRSLLIEAADAFEWISVGPDARSGIGDGRINSVAFDPNNAGLMYAASARGGVYRSENGGARWYPMSDHKVVQASSGQQWIERLGVARLLVTNAGRVLAATGDTERTNSSIEVNFPKAPPDGLYFSDDGGVTWQRQDPTSCAAPENATPGGMGLPISQLLINRTTGTLYLSSDSGIFRSTSNGSCWSDISPKTGGGPFLDLAMSRRANKVVLYTSVAASSASTAIANLILTTADADGAAPTWSAIPVAASAQGPIDPSNQGIGIAKIAALDTVAYAVVGEQPAGTGANTLILYRSDPNSSWNWQRISNVQGNSGDVPCLLGSRGQCLAYDIAIAVNPNAPNDVSVGGNEVLRSVDSGVTWTGLRALHVDDHFIAYGPSSQLWSGDDGGLERATLAPNGGLASSWTFVGAGMDTDLFFGMAMSSTDPYSQSVAGGLQDNGTRSRQAGRFWEAVFGGDGGGSAWDARTPPLLYFQSTDGRNIYRSSDDAVIGNSVLFVADPYKPGVLLSSGVAGDSGSFKLYYGTGADTQSKVSWSCADPVPSKPSEGVSAIAITDSGNYYAGTSGGRVFLITNGNIQNGQFPCSTKGTTATLAWNGAAAFSDPSTPVAKGQIVSIAEDTTDGLTSESLYVTSARFDQFRVVHLVRDSAQLRWTATPIAQNFPHASTHSCLDCGTPVGTFVSPIVADPARAGTVYVGTNTGLFVGQPGSDRIYQWSQEPTMPQVWIEQLDVGRDTRNLVAATLGRGIWEQVFQQFKITDPVRFDPKTASVKVTLPPFSHNPRSSLDVMLSYNTSQPAIVQVLPTSQTNASPFFVSSSLMVQKGSGQATVHIVYAATNAPPLFSTDAMLARMRTEDGSILAQDLVGANVRWYSTDQRQVDLRAQLTVNGEAPTPIAVNLAVSSSNVLAKTPSSIPVPAHAQLSIVAPTYAASNKGRARFVGWGAKIQADDVTAASVPGDFRGRTIVVPIEDNLELTARYEVAVAESEDRDSSPSRRRLPKKRRTQ
jgi:hypothetical protein